MSVFAEPLAQARETLEAIAYTHPANNAQGNLNIFREKAALTLATLDLIEQRAKTTPDECPRGGTHARIAHPGGRCIKCGASAREEAQ